jgi:hypothetical protein
MTDHEFSVEDIEKGIHHALRAQDVQAIPGLLKLMALQDPERAEELRQTMLLGVTIAGAAPTPECCPRCRSLLRGNCYDPMCSCHPEGLLR